MAVGWLDGQKASLVQVAPGAGGGARDKLIGRAGGVKTLERPLRCYSIVFKFLSCLNSVACSLTCSHATTSSANEDEA